MSRARVRLLGCIACAVLVGTGASVTAQASATTQTTVVFLAPAELPVETRAELEDALATQLSLVPAQLRFQSVDTAADSSIEQRIEQARSSAATAGAIATFWLDVHPSTAWFVYAMDTRDPREERLSIRRLEDLPDSMEAAAESVGLIVRATTEALLRGEPIGDKLVDAAPLPPSAAAEPEAPKPHETQVVIASSGRSALRIAAAYVGSTFAKQAPWQNGLAIRGAWLWPAGPYLGLGYTFLPAVRTRVAGLEFSVERHPFALLAGLRFPSGDFTFSAELGAEIELRRRDTTDVPAGQQKDKRTSKLLANICPKLESEYRITSWLAVFASAGLDFVLGNFPYTMDVPENAERSPNYKSQQLLSPWGVRLTVQAGIGIIR